MEDQVFVPLGLQSPEAIRAKLAEIEPAEKAVSFGLESATRTRPWLNTEHQFGYIAPFKPGVQVHHPITSATNMRADAALKGQRINIRLDRLQVHAYPRPLFSPPHSRHNILFNFEARNQVENGSEELVAFNQRYEARVGHSPAISGLPVFIGLTVGANGVGFACRTVNVSNSTDEALIRVLDSKAVTSGLALLTTAQPALAPLAALAQGLCVSLASHNRNVPVQEVRLGLDFDTGATGGRLAVGSYVVAQVAWLGEIVWSEWVYDAEIGGIMRHPEHLAPGEAPYPLPHNAFVFRVSRYES
jgi:hypothetical protein